MHLRSQIEWVRAAEARFNDPKIPHNSKLQFLYEAMSSPVLEDDAVRLFLAQTVYKPITGNVGDAIKPREILAAAGRLADAHHFDLAASENHRKIGEAYSWFIRNVVTEYSYNAEEAADWVREAKRPGYCLEDHIALLEKEVVNIFFDRKDLDSAETFARKTMCPHNERMVETWNTIFDGLEWLHPELARQKDAEISADAMRPTEENACFAYEMLIARTARSTQRERQNRGQLGLF